MFKTAVLATLLALSALAHAQAPTSKKALVAKVLQLQQPGIEAMARQLATAPALNLMQRANLALQTVPAERREAVARDIEADLRKYADEVAPIMSASAVKAAPSTVGTLLEEKMSEEELKQLIAILESPVNKKFQSLAPDMQKLLGDKLVADTRASIEPKLRALDASIVKRLGLQPPAPAASAAKK
jgi:hypothetical protein